MPKWNRLITRWECPRRVPGHPRFARALCPRDMRSLLGRLTWGMFVRWCPYACAGSVSPAVVRLQLLERKTLLMAVASLAAHVGKAPSIALMVHCLHQWSRSHRLELCVRLASLRVNPHRPGCPSGLHLQSSLSCSRHRIPNTREEQRTTRSASRRHRSQTNLAGTGQAACTVLRPASGASPRRTLRTTPWPRRLWSSHCRRPRLCFGTGRSQFAHHDLLLGSKRNSWGSLPRSCSSRFGCQVR